MNVDVPQLVDELKLLRKGRGIHGSSIHDRVGTGLRVACGVAEKDNATQIRDKVSSTLRDLATSLPDDLKVAVSAAFALDEAIRLPLYQERVQWIAEQLDRDQRTARRRIDEGIVRLAELAIARHDPVVRADLPSSDWHTRLLTTVLTLDDPAPEALEFRRIVADHDDIPALDLAITMTTSAGAPPQPEISVLYGGTLVRFQREAADRYGFRLELHKTLRRDETHDFALRVRASEMLPHYVCTPRHPCERFVLHTRFGATQPARVQRLDGVFQRDVNDPEAVGEDVFPDRAGDLNLTFHRLTPGLAYGVRWLT